MNYLTEIKLFYDWLETHELTASGISLWHGLMFIANRSGWKSTICIPLSMIEARTAIPRASIYRERERLRRAGLINYQSIGGKASAIYQINSLEQHLASQNRTQNDSLSDSLSDSQVLVESLDSHLVSQNDMDFENIYKLNYTDTLKEKSEKEMEVGADAPSCLSPEEKKERKSCGKKKEKRESPQIDTAAILQTIEPPWQELMQGWLEYKRLRKESYRSEIGIRKCLTLLRNLSANNPQTATLIIDQSIANNWAGLFEFKRQAYPARGQPATGQRLGQIKQPDSEEDKNRILEKFGNPKK